jgi:hypothetical protein
MPVLLELGKKKDFVQVELCWYIQHSTETVVEMRMTRGTLRSTKVGGMY